METKKKVQKIRQHRNQTGGGPACTTFLSEFDERIVAIVGEFSFDGDSKLVEIGFDNSNEGNTDKIK